MTDIWHADTYTKFLDSRTKPARDLLFSIPDFFSPSVVYDLGCGPGNSTALLADRWPDAKVIGVDSSANMLEKAKETYPTIEFIERDIATFVLQEKVDCIFSNAALQWMGNHDVLLPRLLSFLKPGGFLAIQMPNNYHCPSHQVTVRLLDTHKKWEHLRKELRYGYLTTPLYNFPWYYDLFSGSGANHVQLWETDYFQEMSQHQDIFNWVQGTGLRPILAKMAHSERQEFETLYIDAISKEYPSQKNNKVLMPFRRLFMVACV